MRYFLLLIFYFFLISKQAFTQRIAVLETFTNASCTACATWEPSFNDIIDTLSVPTIRIAYHTALPGLDSMHLENPAEVNDRAARYDLGGTPWTYINGNVVYGTGVLVNFWTPAIIDTMHTSDIPKYKISFENALYKNRFHKGKVVFTSAFDFNATDTLQAYVILIEKDVLKSSYLATPGYNSETHYEYVMRKMMHGSAGVILTHSAIMGSDTISYSYDTWNIKDTANTSIIAFVQNKNTNEIYQAAQIDPVYTYSEWIDNCNPISIVYTDTLYQVSINYDTMYNATMDDIDTIITIDTAHYSSFVGYPIDPIIIPLDVITNEIICGPISSETFLIDTIYIDTNIVVSLMMNSISENKNVVNIFPNPTDEYIQIDFFNSRKHKVAIFNILGEHYSTYFVNDRSIIINVSDLIEGIYIFKIDDNNIYKIMID